MSKFLHGADDNAKAIAIPQVFYENSRTKTEREIIEKYASHSNGTHA